MGTVAGSFSERSESENHPLLQERNNSNQSPTDMNYKETFNKQKRNVLRQVDPTPVRVNRKTRIVPMSSTLSAYIVEDSTGVEETIAAVAPKDLSPKQFFDMLNSGRVTRKGWESLPVEVRTIK